MKILNFDVLPSIISGVDPGDLVLVGITALELQLLFEKTRN